jgi:hypothetical protein
MGGAVHAETDQTCHWQVFKRIATLTGLEKFTVSAIGAGKVPRLQFRIIHGLDARSSLKSLYVLSVVKTPQRLELSPVRWMIDTWPSLRIVAGSLCYDDKDQNRLKDFIKHNVTPRKYMNV